MQLSEAIREGSKMRAPSEKGWNDIGPDGQMRTCPLMAASEAYGLLVIEGTKILPGPKWVEPAPGDAIERGGIKGNIFCRVPDEWIPITMFVDAPPCACEKLTTPEVFEIILHLYDVHRWSREEIADWVEKAEIKLDHKQWVAAKGPDKPWTPGLKW